MHDADIQPSPENAKGYGNGHNRCRLFGSKQVVAASQRYIDTSSDVFGEERTRSFRELLAGMRDDLTP
jgi:hypothetical protein